MSAQVQLGEDQGLSGLAGHVVDVLDEVARTAFARAVGEQLRRAREARGWSRAEFIKRLPSGIGERTLLAYEHGLRQLTLLRLAELCQPLRIDAPTVYARGLQRTCVFLESLTLHVDLRALMQNCSAGRFRPLRPWAVNALNERPSGVMEVEPAAVRNMALFLGSSRHDLATYLARFTPEDDYIDQQEGDSLEGSSGG